MMIFKQLPEFQKEYKQLSKKYESLPIDLSELQNVLTTAPSGHPGKRFHTITENTTCSIIKVRFSCRYLKGSAPLRIIYAYFPKEKRIEFIEIYFKGNKENENRNRIKQYLKKLAVLMGQSL